MVDFRYHLVSLIAVFMALAVGIVLGAGPLQNSIGTALTDQVDSLRQSRDEARADVDAMSADLSKYQEGLTSMRSSLIASSLDGQAIAIVVMPGADGSIVESQRSALEEAGAEIAGTVTIQDGFVSEDLSAYRTALAAQLDNTVAGESTDTMTRLGTALETIMTGEPGANQTLVELLQAGDNQLIEMTDAFSIAATGILVVAGPAMEVDPDATEPQVDTTLVPSAGLVRAFADVPLVVVGETGDQSLVSTIRANSSDGALSTVDSPDDPTSLINVPLALTQEIAGGAVAWGLGEDTSLVIGTRATAPAAPVQDPLNDEGRTGDGQDGTGDPGSETGQTEPGTDVTTDGATGETGP